MEHFMLNEVLITLILVVGGGFIGGMYLRTIPVSSKHLRQQNTDLENLNTYNKKEMKTLRAKVNSSSALPKVSGEPDDIEGVISALLPKITNRFPELKGLIGDGDVSTIIKLAKEHPDIVKKFLPKFISSGKADPDTKLSDSSV